MDKVQIILLGESPSYPATKHDVVEITSLKGRPEF